MNGGVGFFNLLRKEPSPRPSPRGRGSMNGGVGLFNLLRKDPHPALSQREREHERRCRILQPTAEGPSPRPYLPEGEGV